MYLKYFGQNTCCIFCILTRKYKIQYKRSCTATTRPVQCKVTMSHEVQSTLLHKTLFGSIYRPSSVRRKNSVRNIHPDGKMTGYYSVTRTRKATQRYQSAINERIKVSFWRVFWETILKCAKFKIQMHAKMYLKYTSNYKYNMNI